MNQTKQWAIFVVCALVMCMINLDLTTFNLVLATITHEMNASFLTMQWIAGGYIIAAGSMMAFAGRLADVLDHRRVFLLGLVLFIITSIGVAMSTHELEIIVLRMIQGGSIAFLFPISLALIRLHFPKEKQGFMIGSMIAVASLSQALGPMFGAWMLTHLSWRYIFWFNVPFAVLALAVTYWVIPKPQPSKETKKNMRISGVILLATSLLVLMHALNAVKEWGFVSFTFWGFILLSVLTMSLFVYLENKAETPIIDMSLFRSAQFRDVCVIRFIVMFVYFSLLFALGLMLQNVFHYSALHSGHFLMLMTVGLGLIAIFSGKLVDRFGVKKPLLLSLLLLILGLVALITFHYYEHMLWFLLALLLLGCSFALTLPTSASAAILSVDSSRIGATAGVFFTISFIGASLGVAVSGLLLHSFSTKTLHVLLSHSTHTFNAAQKHLLYLAANGAHDLRKSKDLFDQDITHILHQMTKASFMNGFLAIKIVLILLALIALFKCVRLHFEK